MLIRFTVVFIAILAAFSYQGCGGSSGGGGGAPPSTVVLAVVSGDNQTAPEGSTINIVLSVKDQSGADAIGAVIDITATFPNGGSQNLSLTVSGPAPTLVFGLNSGVGTYNISLVATFNGQTSNTLQVTETATAAAVLTALSAVNSTPSGIVGNLISMAVTANDQSGNGIPGQLVRWQITTASGGSTLQDDPTNPTVVARTIDVTTDSTGFATVHMLPMITGQFQIDVAAVSATGTAVSATLSVTVN
ncbi:MAG: hypothetical protein JKY65_23190 [Planctomycetes bacterium]|nr:hypothetical protein [Planctomycetota bacterium]